MQRPNLSPDLFEDHRLIMEAALERDSERAVRCLEHHIRRPPEAVED
jgi:DNA-binding GntR family transcriptional regulator